MSKNFELLQSITNEEELFQTLDGWEDLPETPAEDAEPRPEADGQKPPDPLVPNPLRRPKGGAEPIEGKGGGETQNTALGGRFPISRNPVTRFDSAPTLATWAEPEIAREAEPGEDFLAALEPEALQSIVVPEALPGAEKARLSGLNNAAIEEPRPVKEERTSEEGPQARQDSRKVKHRQPTAGTRINEGKFSGKDLGRKVQVRGAYKDARRELIAREEELKLVQRVFLGAEQDSPRIALFSGLEREGGCAAICARTGEILASQAEGTVCLVDADFHAPWLHEYFGVRNEKGLAEATFESGPIEQFAQQLSPANLWLLPSGYGASQLDLAKIVDRLRARVEEMRRAYRYVIVHSGPLGLNTSAMTFSKWTDGVVLVLEANRTRRDTARRIRESLAAANAKVLGVVLNNRSYPIPESIYGRL